MSTTHVQKQYGQYTYVQIPKIGVRKEVLVEGRSTRTDSSDSWITTNSWVGSHACATKQEITQMLQRNCTLIITFTGEHLQAHPSIMASSSRPQTTVGTIPLVTCSDSTHYNCMSRRTALVTCTVHYYNCSLHSCRWGFVFTVGRKARQLRKESSHVVRKCSAQLCYYCSNKPKCPTHGATLQQKNSEVSVKHNKVKAQLLKSTERLCHSKRMLLINCPDHLLS